MRSGRSGLRGRSCVVLADSFIRTVRTVATRRELATLMEAVAREMGCRHYAIIHHDDLSLGSTDRVNLKVLIVAEK